MNREGVLCALGPCLHNMTLT